MKLNVLDFPAATLGQCAALALQQAKDGDSIYCPGVQFTNGQVYGAPAGGFQITKSLELHGDGPGDAGLFTGTIFSAPAGSPVFVIAPAVADMTVRLRDFKIKPPAVPGDDEDGVRCNLTTGQTVGVTRLERVNALDLGGKGFRIEAADSGGVRLVALLDSAATGCLDLGTVLRRVLSVRGTRSVMNSNRKGGMLCEFSGVALYLPSFDAAPADPTIQAQLKFASCHVARVDAGHFENFAETTTPEGCRFDGSGGAAMIGASTFTVRDTTAPPLSQEEVPPSTGVAVPAEASSGPLVALCNRLTRVHPYLVAAPSGVSDLCLLPQFNDERTFAGPEPGSVDLPADPNDGAMAQPYIARAESAPASAGIIIPSGAGDPMQNVQDGMLYYDVTANALRMRKGGVWKTVEVESVS